MGCGSSVHASRPATSEQKISFAPAVETETLEIMPAASTCEKEDTFSVNPNPHKEFLPCCNPSTLELKCRSTIAKLAPRSSEESARKEVEELMQCWIKSGQLADIESYSFSTPPSLSTTITELSEYLTRSSCNYVKAIENNMLHIQVAKAYCIYFWIANNITYDGQLWQAYQIGDINNFEHSTQAENVLERRRTVSSGYANLFKSLASKSGLKVEVISGNIKEWKSQSMSCPENEFELSRNNTHAWNSITFGDVAYLVDCTLGSGYISQNAEYQSDFTCHFFSVKPQDFILTHWPSRDNQQMLTRPLAFSEFQPLIPLSSREFGLGINPGTWSEILEIPVGIHDPVVFITMTCNVDSKILAKLSTKQETEDSNELSNVFVHREVSSTDKRKNNTKIWAVVPYTGWHVLDIYACKSSSDTSDHNYHLALSYQILSNMVVGSQLQIGYPKVYDLAAAAFDFQILHWNKPMPAYCCETSAGELDVVFRAKPGLQFDHYIVASAQEADNQDGVYQYNTLIAQNKCCDAGLYVLRCVFPSQGFWSVCLCATKVVDYDCQDPTLSGYTSIFKYRVYVKNGAKNKSFPHFIAPYITLNKPSTISAFGNEILNVQFCSSRQLDFHSYLTFEISTGEPLESYTAVSDSAKGTQNELQYQYNLSVIFPKPGKWYVHLFGRESINAEKKYNELCILSVVVEGALSNKRFPKIDYSIANSLKFSCYATGCVSFCDNGSPFTYKFRAPGSGIHLIPSINPGNKDESSFDEEYLQRCTLLSPCKTDDGDTYIYTMNAIFPSPGIWSVQLFGSLSDSEVDDYKLVFYIQLLVSKPTPNKCYPTIYPAFYNLGLSIPDELLLYSRENSDSDIRLPFHSPENVLFDTRLVQGDDVFVNQAMVRKNGVTAADLNHRTQNRQLHIIFPKTGELVVYLYAGSFSADQSEGHQCVDKEAVLELKIRALSYNDKLAFPQIFDPFYCMFSLKLDEGWYPLSSTVDSFPSKITLAFYSPPGVKFWHSGKLSTSLDAKPITRIESDPHTGLCKLSVEVNEHGQWSVTLNAKKSDAPDNQEWVTVLSHTVQTV